MRMGESPSGKQSFQTGNGAKHEALAGIVRQETIGRKLMNPSCCGPDDLRFCTECLFDAQQKLLVVNQLFEPVASDVVL